MLWHELISYVSDLSLPNAAALLDEQRVDDGLEQVG
jgi:hypothetical protein